MRAKKPPVRRSRVAPAKPGTLTRDELREIAELEVRRYFDHYLREVFPKQVKELISHHDRNVFAHGGIVRKFAQAKYLVVGFACAGGFIGGAGLERLIGLLR
jgi:hypothetical protein